MSLQKNPFEILNDPTISPGTDFQESDVSFSADVDTLSEQVVVPEIGDNASEYSESEEDLSTDEDSSDIYENDLIDFAYTEKERLAKIQKDWEESVQQLKQAVNWIILPLIGKVVGRRCARLLWNYAYQKIWG